MPLLDSRLVTAAALAGNYLPVRIRGESYGIPSDRARGQADMRELLARPDLADWVAGFVTRRGRLIPVLDLYRALSGGSVPPMEVRILLVQSHSAAHPGLPVGLCVDAIGEPLYLAEEMIFPRVNFRHGVDSMPCLAEVSGPVRAVLDLDAIVEQSIFRARTGPTS